MAQGSTSPASPPPATGGPVVAPVVVQTPGVPVDPALAYQGIRAARRIIQDRIDNLEDRRDELVAMRRAGGASDTDRAGLDQQLAQVDQQLAAANIELAEMETRLTQAATVPGATAEPPRPDPWASGPPEEVVMMTIFFGTVLLMPLVIAYSRRLWRRSSQVAVNVPPQLTEKLESLERSVEAVAVEVERIGEGQRFVTQLLAERAKAPALPAERSGGRGGAPTA